MIGRFPCRDGRYPASSPSAVTTALSASGLPADRYTFLGFLPRKGTARRALLDTITNSPLTVVLFESAARLGSLLKVLADEGDADREAVVARELTKIHEEIRFGTLSELAGYYRDQAPKGEITVVIAGAKTTESPPDPETLKGRARELLATGSSRRDAAATLAAESGISRNKAYELVTSL